MTKVRFLELSGAKRAKACNCNSYKELVEKACIERAKFNDLFNLDTAMYRIYKSVHSKPRKAREHKPLYHKVTNNMLIQNMYNDIVPKDERYY